MVQGGATVPGVAVGGGGYSPRGYSQGGYSGKALPLPRPHVEGQHV